MSTPSYPPECLSLWDRLFNRYRTEVHQRGNEEWRRNTSWGSRIAESEYYRDWIEYKIIDRLTGGYTIKREYLN